jgi:Protein of unknown function (DUF3107)
VEVKIGVQHANRELVVETNLSSDEIEKTVTEALKTETGLLSLTDSKGRRIMIPADRLAYVELGTPTSGQVGFRS